MNRSLRWRLQGWYAVVLLAVVGGFATLLYAQVRSAQFQKIDAALKADALYIDTNLRRVPPHVWDGGRPDDHPPPDEFGAGFHPGPPPDRFEDRPPPERVDHRIAKLQVVGDRPGRIANGCWPN